MKRNIYILGILAIALSGCAKNELVGNGDGDNSNEISFSSYSGRQVTKGSGYADYTVSSGYEVHAYIGSDNYFADNFVNNTAVSTGKGEKYYWPLEVSSTSKMKFYAVAPKSSGYNTITKQSGGDMVIANFDASSGNTDLVYAQSSEYSEMPSGGTVSLTFNHALAKISSVRIKTKSGDGTATAGFFYNVESLVISGKTSGTYNITDAVWESLSTDGGYTYISSKTSKEGNFDVDTIKTGGKYLANSLIPQEVTVSVTYGITQNSASGASIMDPVTKTGKFTLEKGKTYSVTVELSNDNDEFGAIIFNAVEEEWGEEPVDPNLKALKMVARGEEPQTVTLTRPDSFVSNGIDFPDLEYSNDGRTWQTWAKTSSSATCLPAVSFVASGTDTLYIRGINPEGFTPSGQGDQSFFSFEFSNPESCVEVYGSVMSLLNYEEDLDAIPNNCCFAGLFKDCESLIYSSEELLPATTLKDSCYYCLFSGCGLENMPELPAMTLTKSCYEYMFAECLSLCYIDELPATTLAERCYASMFCNTSLFSVEESLLPAMTMAKGCYSNMFYGCEYLQNAPNLPSTTLADNCYDSMFYECISLPNVPQMSAKTLANNCCQCMFFGCETIEDVPEDYLLADRLDTLCYAGMFQNCIELRQAPILSPLFLPSGCYMNMFSGCENLKTVKAAFVGFGDGTNISCTDALNGWIENSGVTTVYLNQDRPWKSGNTTTYPGNNQDSNFIPSGVTICPFGYCAIFNATRILNIYGSQWAEWTPKWRLQSPIGEEFLMHCCGCLIENVDPTYKVDIVLTKTEYGGISMAVLMNWGFLSENQILYVYDGWINNKTPVVSSSQSYEDIYDAILVPYYAQ